MQREGRGDKRPLPEEEAAADAFDEAAAVSDADGADGAAAADSGSARRKAPRRAAWKEKEDALLRYWHPRYVGTTPDWHHAVAGHLAPRSANEVVLHPPEEELRLSPEE